MSEEIETKAITTIDEDGNEINLVLQDIVKVDESEYALLTREEDDPEDDETEVVLMRLTKDGEDYIFEVIEDDDEFDLVSQAIIDDSNQDEE